MLDHVEWHIPSRVTHTQFSGVLTLEDIEQANQLSYELTEREGHDDGVYAMVDITRCESFGSDLMNLNSLRATSNIHPRMRWLVAVEGGSTNPVFRFLALSVIKILRLKYTLVRSTSEAIDFIRHLDPSVDRM